jgi:hypothetical protein
MPLLWILVECGLAGIKGWPLGPMTAPAIVVREALSPLLWLAALLTREIAWGNHPVRLTSPPGGKP